MQLLINKDFSSSPHFLELFAIFLPKAFSKFSEVYPTTGHVEENVRGFFETYKIDSHRFAVELYSFATAIKLFNFDTVKSKTDRTEYGEVSDVFSDSTEDTDDEYGVDMHGKHQTFIDSLSVLTNSSLLYCIGDSENLQFC